MVVRRLMLPLALSAAFMPAQLLARDMAAEHVVRAESATVQSDTPGAPITAGTPSAPAGGKKAHWSYQGKEGPEHWGNLDASFGACATGRNQSPVDLRGPDIRSRRSSVRLDYRALPFSVKHTGHSIQADPRENRHLPSVRIGERTFVLKQFHFHTPSEHTFAGRHFPMEVHLVHKSEDGQLAVLAAMIRPGASNVVLERLLNHPVKEGEVADVEKPLHVRALLPKRLSHYRLNGSLTTPPCSEGVNWVVFTQSVYASREQIQKLGALVEGDNNRPVQPFNARLLVEETR